MSSKKTHNMFTFLNRIRTEEFKECYKVGYKLTFIHELKYRQ